MQRWDALLFDFDGVLADTEPIHFDCWSQILEPFGITLGWDYYQAQCIGVSDRLMIERLAAARVPPIPFDDIWRRYDRKKELFRQIHEQQSPFSDETLRLIEEVAGTYKLAVVSSSGRTEVEPPIERAGIRSHFQALVCGREAQELKPHPAPYLRAAALLGAERPLAIEDSDAGVESARAAGFEVLRVSNASTMPSELLAHLKGS